MTRHEMAHPTTLPLREARAFGENAAAVAVFVVERLLEWIERAQQRRALLRMNDRMLHDLGISRADAEWEAARPFWRP